MRDKILRTECSLNVAIDYGHTRHVRELKLSRRRNEIDKISKNIGGTLSKERHDAVRRG